MKTLRQEGEGILIGLNEVKVEKNSVGDTKVSFRRS